MVGFILTPAAQQYAWQALASRAGLPEASGDGNSFDSLNLDVQYGPPPPVGHAGQNRLYIVPAHSASWEQLRTLPPGQLDWLPPAQVFPPGASRVIDDPIPVLFWGEGFQKGQQPFAELREDGVLVFYADLLAAAIFMLARWEETLPGERDEFGRFLGVDSTAYRQSFFDRPVVDEYGLILREWLRVIRPGWQPVPKRFSVRLTHDIDHLSASLFRRARLCLEDLLKRKQPAAAAYALEYILMKPGVDPLVEGLHDLIENSCRHQMISSFYFMAATPGRLDEGYDIGSPLARGEIARIQSLGFEIGLHTGFSTLDEPERVGIEKARLEKQLGHPVTAARQHYLRIAVPKTWRIWEEYGFLHDSSLGYSDLEGFRAGTCHPYWLFDLERDRILKVEEQPLIVMDGTLRVNRRMSKEGARKRILELARRCRTAEGCFTLLWHNSSLWREYRPWRSLYQNLLPELKSLEQDQHQSLSESASYSG